MAGLLRSAKPPCPPASRLAGLASRGRSLPPLLLGVHCFGDIASEVVNLGHVVVQSRGSVESFLTLALATPTYGYAYHDAAVDGLTQLSLAMRPADRGAPGAPAP